MNFCPKCGNKLNENAAFCSACGNPLNAAPQQNTQPAQPSQPAQPVQYAHPVQYVQPVSAPSVQMSAPSVSLKLGGASWVKWAILGVIAAAIITLVVVLLPKSDEAKIRDRLDDFETACTDMDMEGMFNCFDRKTRKTYESTMSVADGLLGGLTGIDLPYSDIAELGGMEMAGSGEFEMDIEVKSIVVEDDIAFVEVVMTNGGESGEDTIVMCKEEDDWFIDFEETSGDSLLGSMFGDLY